VGRYDTDFAVWAYEQVSALRRGDLAGLDAEHLAEEVEGLVKADRRAIASQIERILLHLLKWRYQPALRSIGWRRSIAQGRNEIATLIEDSPSLAGMLPEAMARRYRAARAGAILETGLPGTLFPKECPFALDEVLHDAGLGETIGEE